MDFCRNAFSSAEAFDERKVEEGESGEERARICELRNCSLRSMIVGTEAAILIELKVVERCSGVVSMGKTRGGRASRDFRQRGLVQYGSNLNLTSHFDLLTFLAVCFLILKDLHPISCFEDMAAM